MAALPWMAHDVPARRVDPRDCKVQTGIPSNSLRCAFSPSVVNHGGPTLDQQVVLSVSRVSTPKMAVVKSVNPRRIWNAAVVTRATNDG